MTFPLPFVSEIPVFRVVPIRFARATVGRATHASPDLDIRGYVPTAGGNAHGPSLGLTEGQHGRVKVVRDWLSPAAALHVSVADASVVTVRRPGAHAALDPLLRTERLGVTDGHGGARVIEIAVDGDDYAADTIDLEAPTGQSDEVRETTLRVHYGDGGPVVGELFVRVYKALPVRVRLHVVRIASHHHPHTFVGPTTTEADLRRNIERAAEVFLQAGVVLQIAADVDHHDIHLAHAGLVHVPEEGGGDESPRVLRLAPVQRHLNVYAVHGFPDGDGLDGLGTNRGWGAQAGLIVSDYSEEWYGTQVTAHEMGHTFGLEHYANGNGSNGTRSDQREDIFARRNLMWNGQTSHWRQNFYRPSRFRGDNGYPGEGGAIFCKHISGLVQSDQVAAIRDNIAHLRYAPRPPSTHHHH